MVIGFCYLYKIKDVVRFGGLEIYFKIFLALSGSGLPGGCRDLEVGSDVPI